MLQVPSNSTCPLDHVDGVYDGEEIQCVKMECPKLELGEHLKIKSETCSNEFKCNCVVTFECEDGKRCFVQLCFDWPQFAL